uniref:Uncharacterized protein n=1 Tax=Chlamydomonas euryale TaxID=1486919 RepID=A0A7R9Z956_9CHLO
MAPASTATFWTMKFQRRAENNGPLGCMHTDEATPVSVMVHASVPATCDLPNASSKKLNRYCGQLGASRAPCPAVMDPPMVTTLVGCPQAISDNFFRNRDAAPM